MTNTLKTSLRRLNKYLDKSAENLPILENQYRELADLIGMPEDGTNFGHNIYKLLLATEPFESKINVKNSLKLLQAIKDKLEENQQAFLPRFPEKNKTSRSPYSTSEYPIYKEIDYLPAEIENFDPEYYLQLQCIRLSVNLRMLGKYKSNQFHPFFKNYKDLIAELLGHYPEELNLELASSYKHFILFVETNGDDISSLGTSAEELVNYVLHATLHNHKTPRQPSSNRKIPGDSLSKSTPKVDATPSENNIKRPTSDRNNLRGLIARGQSSAARKLIGNYDIGSDGDRSIVILKAPKDDLPNDGTESDYEDITREQIELEEKIEDEPLSKAWNQRAAKRSMLKTINRAQFLKQDWNALTTIERDQIVEEALSELNSTNEVSIGAFSAIFTLTTGSEPMAWGSWLFCEHPNTPYLNLERGCYSHYCEFEEGRWEPNSDQLPKLEHPTHHNELVELPIEDHLLSFLRQKFQGQTTVAEIFQFEVKELQDQTDEWIKSTIKKLNTSRWFTTKRVRDDLFFQVMFNHHDEPMANHICAQNIYEMPMGVTYAQFTQSQLLETYLAVQHPKLSFSNTPRLQADGAVGSWLQPSRNFLKDFVQNLKLQYEVSLQGITSSASIEQVVSTHNAFVNYLLFSGFVGTSTRHNDDPFPHKHAFLMALNAVLVTDKVIGYENETRVSIFPDNFKQLIHSYQEQLKSLRFWLAALGYQKQAGLVLSAESFEQQKIPYVFYLDFKGVGLTITSITRDVLDQKMPDFGLPWNFGRHLRATWLRELSISPEFINYDLGHIRVGEQPHASYSLLSVPLIKDTLLPAVNQIFDELGITPIDAMPFKQRYPAKIDIDDSVSPRELGYQKRKRKRLEGIVSDKEVVKTALADVAIEAPQNLTEKKLEKALTKIMEANPQNLIKTLNLFARITSSVIRKQRLDIKTPSKLFKVKAEPSIFTDQSFHLIHQAKVIRDELESLMLHQPDITKLKTKLLLQKDYIWKTIFSIISHSMITSKPLIKELLYGIRRQDFMYSQQDKIVHVQLRHTNGQVYKKVPLHPVTGMLALRLGTDFGFPEHFVIKSWANSNSLEIGLKLLNASQLFTNPITLSSFLRACRELAKVSMPGYVCAKLDGRSGYGSYSEKVSARIEKDIHQHLPSEKLKLTSQNSDPQPASSSEWLHSVKNAYLKKPNGFLELKQLRKDLNALMRESIDKEALKTALESKWKNRDEDNALPQMAYLLMHWLRFMAENTRGQNRGVTYIYSRFNYLSKDLIEQFYGLNLLKMSAQQRREIYQEIIDLRENGQDTRKEGLLLFDQFLQAQCGLSKIQSSSLEALSEEHIDANLVTQEEYQQIFDLLAEQSEPAALLFQLKWCFGDRPSEIPFITQKDLTINQREGYITIKNHPQRGLKTSASKRLLLMRLTEIQTGHLTPLTDTQNNAVFNNTDELLETIVKAIRQVTDDSSLSIRNLRHGVATRWLRTLTDSIYFNKNNANMSDSFTADLGGSLITRRAIFMVSRNLGHGGPSTFLYHYSHEHETTIGNLYQNLVDSTRKSKFYSIITGISDSAVRKQLSRRKPLDGLVCNKDSQVLDVFWKKIKKS